MGINYRKKVLLNEVILKNCSKCKKVYSEKCVFCQTCGEKLTTMKAQTFANIGKNGISSITYKLPNGVTLNSKGNVTIKLAQGLSYSTKLK